MAETFKQYQSESNTKVRAFRITADYVNSCPRMGGGPLKHGEGIMLYTGAYKGREKEVQYGQVGDYVVQCNNNLAVISKDVFENELKLKEVEETIEESVITNGDENAGTNDGDDVSGSGSDGTGDAGSAATHSGADQPSSGDTGGTPSETSRSTEPTLPSPGEDNARDNLGHRKDGKEKSVSSS